MPQSLEQRIAAIRAKSAEAKRIEDEYQTVKETVSQLWKQYWPAAESKKDLQEKRKAIKAELKAMIDADTELKTLINSIS